MIEWLTHNNTTGEHYHTLFHCMSGDNIWVYLIQITLILVIAQYVAIANQARKKRRGFEKTQLNKTFINFILVFVVCAITGYGFRIIQSWFPAYKLLLVLLVILNVVTYKFRSTLSDTGFFEKFFGMDNKLEKLKKENLRLRNEIKAQKILNHND